MGRRALLVAATGGHLAQICRLEALLSPRFQYVAFATFDGPQSRSLLVGRDVHYVSYIPPRGLKESLAGLASAGSIIRRGRFTDVISTGNAIAVPFLMMARQMGLRAHYIESAARTMGPSRTGQICRWVPGVHLYSQYPTWATGPWHFRGSVFSRFTAQASLPLASASRIVVTLGTKNGYAFGRAVQAAERVLAEVGAADREVLWQLGDTPGTGLAGQVHDIVPAADLAQAVAEADLVISHSGIGSALQSLDAGRAPILLPRARAHGEHIDDHQSLIAAELMRRELAISRAPSALTATDAISAMSRRIIGSADISPFALEGAIEGPDPFLIPTPAEA